MFLRKDAPGRTAMWREDFLSVAIASCARFDFLRRVIDAVHAHADMPFEIVVSDDAGHLRQDLRAFDEIASKVSRIVVNTGCNTGLAVNANMAIGATRGRNVVFLSDDSLVLAPFMQRCWDALESAPYLGVLYLGQTYNADKDREAYVTIARERGLLRARTATGSRLLLHCRHGSSWANAFRRSYWLEVGGYAEDDIYGDLPFINKGWRRGYLSGASDGVPMAYDIDVVETCKTRSSVPTAAHGALCHYPRLFHLSEEAQIAMARNRTAACGWRNHAGRATPLNEYGCEDWVAHMQSVTRTGTVDWTRFSTHHGRFLKAVRADVQRELEAE